MQLKDVLTITFVAMLAVGCSQQASDVNSSAEKTTVNLRHLAERTSAPAEKKYTLHGSRISTPSDARSRYYLLWLRQPLLSGTQVALLRQELGSRVAYARVEVDCSKRLFHVLSVGPRRSFAETSIAYDGPLRSIEGLPLRQELAQSVCETAGTPLATA